MSLLPPRLSRFDRRWRRVSDIDTDKDKIEVNVLCTITSQICQLTAALSDGNENKISDDHLLGESPLHSINQSLTDINLLVGFGAFVLDVLYGSDSVTPTLSD